MGYRVEMDNIYNLVKNYKAGYKHEIKLLVHSVMIKIVYGFTYFNVKE